MAPTKAFEVKAQKVTTRNSIDSQRISSPSKRYRSSYPVRPNSSDFIPSLDYSKNKEIYQKIPDISEKELRENFLKRLTMSQRSVLE